MPIKKWKKEIFTIPNMLSLIRILLIPVYVRVYIRASRGTDYLLAGGILAVSCLTDGIDGWIARRFDWITSIGKVLDPIADKLTQLALILCLSAKYTGLYPVLALFLVKEIFQIGALIIHYHQGKVLPGALPAGKLCTFVLFGSFIALVLFPNMNMFLANCLVFCDFILLFLSFSQYALAYYGKSKKILDL